MKKKKNIERAVEDCLDALENVSEIDPSPFLKDKILAQIAKEKKSSVKIFKPSFALGLAAAIIVLLINIFSISAYLNGNADFRKDPYAKLQASYQVRSEVDYQMLLP